MAQDDSPKGDGEASVPGSRTYVMRYERGKRPSLGVIEAVAEATGTDPSSMQPLYEAIDPDALDGLFDSDSTRSRCSSDGRVKFRFTGCTVVVRADGLIVVSLSAADRS